MLRHLLMTATAVLGLAASLTFPNQAKASEWGCQVLLCAASSNPSWKGIPFCHAPMYKLIACRAKTFGACSWPRCTQAGTGAPGYQAYEPCPAGWSPGQIDMSDSGSSGRDVCQKQVRNSSCSSGQGDCNQYTTRTMNRTRKTNPYFFNIKDDTTGEVGTHWFNLNK